MIFTPVKILDVENPDKLPILTKKVQVGEDVILRFKYVKYINIFPETIREIRCQKSIEFINKSPRRLPPGSYEFDLAYQVPIGMPSDKQCRIYIFATYHPNFFRTERYIFTTEPFEVYNPLYEILD